MADQSWLEQANNLTRGINGTDSEVSDANSRQAAIAAQQEMQALGEALKKGGEMSPAVYNASLKRYQQLADQVKSFDPNQRDVAGQATRNAGTLGENTYYSNLANLNAQDIQQQNTGRNQLSLATAANPLVQYQNDSDLKRKMALNNQSNLAQNVRDQLTQLGNARQSNANMINQAMTQGRQTF